jgi:hypothetical protein
LQDGTDNWDAPSRASQSEMKPIPGPATPEIISSSLFPQLWSSVSKPFSKQFRKVFELWRNGYCITTSCGRTTICRHCRAAIRSTGRAYRLRPTRRLKVVEPTLRAARCKC